MVAQIDSIHGELDEHIGGKLLVMLLLNWCVIKVEWICLPNC